MKWPWKRGKEEPMRSPTTATIADEAPTDDLQRSHEALLAAQRAYHQAAARRPAVDAAGQALQRTINRNHLAELVRGALGSGS